MKDETIESTISARASKLVGETRDEISRADSKAMGVLAISGLASGILLSSNFGSVNWPLYGWDIVHLLALIGLLVGIGVMASAIWPRTTHRTGADIHYFGDVGVPRRRIAKLDAEQRQSLLSDVTARLDHATTHGRDVTQFVVLSDIVATKYQRVRIGMWITGIGFLLAVSWRAFGTS